MRSVLLIRICTLPAAYEACDEVDDGLIDLLAHSMQALAVIVELRLCDLIVLSYDLYCFEPPVSCRLAAGDSVQQVLQVLVGYEAGECSDPDSRSSDAFDREHYDEAMDVAFD